MEEEIPADVIEGGAEVVARYLLRATPMGAFLRNPSVIKMLAEDRVLRDFMPWVHVVRPMEGEEQLIRDWAEARPNIHAPLLSIAHHELASFAAVDDEGSRLRIMVRLAAYRRLDAAYCGEQVFAKSPELGGEPYFHVLVPGLADPMRVGVVSSARYVGDPKKDAEILEICRNAEAISAVEDAIAGCVPFEDTPNAWAKTVNNLAAANAMRSWERSNKTSLLAHGWWFDVMNLPEGIVLRRGASQLLHDCGHEGPLLIMRQLGISPFIAEVGQGYLDSQMMECAEAEKDEGLAFSHLMSCDLLHEILKKSLASAP